MNNFTAVIFDMDGTLIDSMQIWRNVDKEFLHCRGLEVPTDLFENLPSGNSFIQTAQYFKTRFGLPDSPESIMQEWTKMVCNHYENNIKLKPGATELLIALKEKGIKIGLGTSNSLELAKKVLMRNAVWHYFQCAITGDIDLMGKPYPDIYLKAAKHLCEEPQHCLVIEDTLTGVQAGKAAGMTVFAVYDEDSRDQHSSMKMVADGFFPDLKILSEEFFRILE
ncbi:MAG: HAD family phosphatase [Candidatus Cloacimonas sp.]